MPILVDRCPIMQSIERSHLRKMVGRFALILLFYAGGSDVALASPKRVLLLHSFGLDAPPWSEYSKHIRAELFKKMPHEIDLVEATLESARLPDTVDDSPFADYLAALFSKHPPDLVITVAPLAARFVQQQRQRLFINIPLLVTATEPRRYSRSPNSNETAVLTDINLLTAMQNILDVLPATDHIAVILGASPLERFWKEEVIKAVKPLSGRVTFSFFNDLSFEEMLKTASTLPPRSALFFGALSVDINGVPLIDGGIFSRFREASNAPIFSYDDSHFGEGLVGGPMLSIDDISRRTADTATRILSSGEVASSIPTTIIGYASPRFDWRELQRWRVKEANLIPGSQVIFRELSFWSQHRWTVIGVASAIVFQAVMICALLFERIRRRLAEAASRNRLLELAKMNRSLTVSAISSSIAHELNQPLGAILNNTGAAELLLSRSPPDIDQIRQILADIRTDDERAGEIIGHLRGFLRADEATPSDVNIKRAIEDVIHIIEPEAAKRGIALESDQALQPFSVRGDRVHLQQVLLNLALNGLDAMQDTASNKRLAFQTSRLDDARVEIAVLDTGTGIPESKLKEIFDSFITTKKFGTGLGLSIARTIVEMYGGRIWAENRENGGAAFRFVLPQAKSTA